MADKQRRGTARVTFIAHLELIRRELEQGWTAQAIYDRHPELFSGAISYAHFARYAAQVRGARPITSSRSPKPKPAVPQQSSAAPASPKEPTDARSERHGGSGFRAPAPRPQEGELEGLLGPLHKPRK